MNGYYIYIYDSEKEETNIAKRLSESVLMYVGTNQ